MVHSRGLMAIKTTDLSPFVMLPFVALLLSWFACDEFKLISQLVIRPSLLILLTFILLITHMRAIRLENLPIDLPQNLSK